MENRIHEDEYTGNTGRFFYRCPITASVKGLSGECKVSMQSSCRARENDTKTPLLYKLEEEEEEG